MGWAAVFFWRLFSNIIATITLAQVILTIACNVNTSDLHVTTQHTTNQLKLMLSPSVNCLVQHCHMNVGLAKLFMQ